VNTASEYSSFEKERLVSLLVERDHEIDKLHHLLIQARKNLFGKKSEKLSSANQTELFSFAAPAVEEEASSEAAVIEVPSHTRKVRKKRELPGDIERERIEYDIPDPRCPCCQKEMPVIGEETSEELEFIPAQFKVLEHVRFKRACGTCKNGVYTPTLPPEVKPLERRAAGAGLVAQILVSKYQDHQPLYRQEQIFARHGITIPRRLMCGWVEGAVELLMPLYEELKKELLQESYLQADETGLKVQDPEVKGKLHQGYLWGMLSPSNKVLFHYAESRAGEVPRELFKDFRGAIQTDAYAGYNKVYIPDRCRRVACLAHIRRKFIESEASAKAKSGKILGLIAELYKLERKFKDDPPEERMRRRKKKSFPIFKKLYRLLRALKKETLPQAAFQKALSYAYDQRYAMLAVLRDGRFEIDNNLIENQMRPVALGRKNYLFAGSHDGAKRAAVIYSLLGTCKLNGVNPFNWLRDVLRRVHSKGTTAAELLPQRWKHGSKKA